MMKKPLSVNYFGISDSRSEELPIHEFLENNDIIILSATKKDSSLKFSHAISEDENSLVFYKIPQVGKNCGANDGDVQLGLVTLEGGLAKSIYNSISTVFSPYVAKVRSSLIELLNLILTVHF